ncbi:MAG: hypothetical protein PHU23_02180 [Dehalococcoidales bacterium]|nr:hypothetical protein [Dehalococcoidales bacterium]
MAEKKSLTILSVGSIVEVGEKKLPKLSFAANDGEGKYSYFTFDSKLFPVIRNGVNQVIEFDIETSQSGDYVNRKVINAYINGLPVIVKGAGSSRRAYGKSPEEIRSERLSIETQVAAKLAVELRIAEKLPDNSPVFQDALKWIKTKLTASLS